METLPNSLPKNNLRITKALKSKFVGVGGHCNLFYNFSSGIQEQLINHLTSYIIFRTLQLNIV